MYCNMCNGFGTENKMLKVRWIQYYKTLLCENVVSWNGWIFTVIYPIVTNFSYHRWDNGSKSWSPVTDTSAPQSIQHQCFRCLPGKVPDISSWWGWWWVGTWIQTFGILWCINDWGLLSPAYKNRHISNGAGRKFKWWSYKTGEFSETIRPELSKPEPCYRKSTIREAERGFWGKWTGWADGKWGATPGQGGDWKAGQAAGSPGGFTWAYSFYLVELQSNIFLLDIYREIIGCL